MSTEKNPTTTEKRSQTRIWITDQHTRELVAEFGISGSHVRNCLKFYTDSDLAKKVRERAIEKMEKTIARNKELMQEYDQD